MVVYLLTIALVSITSITAQQFKQKKTGNVLNSIFAFLTALILILIAGLRWKVGTDYGTYIDLYPQYKSNLWNSLINFDEPGIRIISYISSLIYDDYFVMFFISSLITVGLSIWTISKYSKSFFVSIMLYIFIGAWHGSFNGVRQYLACAILFAGHHYIIDKKFLRYLIIVLIASLFHISALPMFFLYFVPQVKLTFKQVGMLTFVVLVGLFSYDVFFEIIDNILLTQNRTITEGSYLTEQVSIIRILVMIAPTILYLFITPKSYLSNEDNFYINMMIVNALIFIITYNSAYLARFTIYTSVFVTLAFPKIFTGVNRKLSVLIQYIALILFFIFWSFEIYVNPHLIDYQWIFEK